MKHYPEYFLGERYSEPGGIILNPVRTDKDFSIDRLPLVRQIESDDICVVIVFQEPAVDIKQVLVGAEDIVYAFQFLSLLLQYAFNVRFQRAPVSEGEIYKEVKMYVGGI